MADYPDSSSNPLSENQYGSQAADKAKETIDRTAQGAHDLVDRAAAKARPAVDHLRSSVNSASAAVQSGVEEFGEYQERWLANCRGQVRDYPIVSLGIAVVAGMVISRLLSR
ncbi:MAG: hypothetical protein ABI478_05370 [Propionivibrio sp.]